MKKKLEALLAEIKSLASKDSLTDEEQDQLETKIQDAEKIKLQIKALEMTEEPEDESQDDTQAKIDEAVEIKFKAFLAEQDKAKGKYKVPPAVMKAAQLGDPDPEEDFYKWVMTGESRIKKHVNHEAEMPYFEIDAVTGQRSVKYLKAALQEGTDGEGGYLVPAVSLGRIYSKRDETSLIARLGAMTFDTDRDVYQIPAESTSLGKFTIVAEEGAVSAAEEEPTFADPNTTLYKFMKVIKLSAELEEDFNSGLANFLTSAIGRAWGITENYYCQIGSGSGMPQGVFAGGTAGLTLDAAAAIGAAEVPELIGKLKVAYRDGAVLLMNRTTVAYLRGLSGNVFQFGGMPTSPMTAGGEDLGIGYPVIATEDAAAIAASAKSMLFGNFALYGWVRNRSLQIQRMNELYRGNDQIGLHCKFRAGGKVIVAEAFQYATHPTA